MTHTYNITGMTCNNCKASVINYLSELPTVSDVNINLEKGEAEIKMKEHIDLQTLKAALPEKYTITEKNTTKNTSVNALKTPVTKQQSKLEQLKPLLIIIFYIATASIFMNYKNWFWQDFMLDFMGLFYIVFSFFKMLDLKGFPESFKMYDPLAKKVPVYATLYPFIETALGIMLLGRLEVKLALFITIIILGVTTFGVVKTLLSKKAIRCACLGTVLNLPMTEATFIENAIMIVMASTMLLF